MISVSTETLGPETASGIFARTSWRARSARTTDASPPPESAMRASSIVSVESSASSSSRFCGT